MYKKTKALVLREIKYKEADKILTVLTENEGKLSLSARGVMRQKSKLAAGSQLFTFSDMTLYENKGKWYLKETQTIEQFLGLRDDIENIALAAYFAELLEAVCDEDSPDGQILSLGLNSLFALSNKLYEPEHIKASFELRLMCLSGYEPAVLHCPVCGNVNIEQPVFSTVEGTVMCSSCANAAYTGRFPLCPSSLDAMRYIINADRKRILSFTIDKTAEKMLCAACEGFVTAQLERGFSSLAYWRNLINRESSKR